ncbi:mitochondrial carrier domain-containing protein [Zopfochytrium polystomum]|nr:mitochondrial carrier domain-containing protein [Zopfochytrium polystomum]
MSDSDPHRPLSTRDQPAIAHSAKEATSPLPLIPRILAASGGALLVALLVTPFDVVKTRMQAGFTASPAATRMPLADGSRLQRVPAVSRLLAPSHPPPPSSLPPLSAADIDAIPPDRCCREFNATRPPQTTASSAARLAEEQMICKLHPGRYMVVPGVCPYQFVDGVRKPVVPVPATRYTGTIDGLRQIMKAEGVSGLWRGITPALILQIPSTVIYYVGYEAVRDSFHDGLSRWNAQGYAALLAGSFARTIATTAFSPIELVKTRMQASAEEGTFVGITRQVSAMVRANGWHSLWRGLGPTLWRDVPFSGIYWAGYESLKPKLLPDLEGQRPTAGQEFLAAFTAGAVAGTVAAVVTTPFDVAKTLQQTIHHNEPGCLSSPSQQLKFVKVLRSVAETEGLPGLFRGLSPRIARIAPACAVMISSYEVGKLFFESQARI